MHSRPQQTATQSHHHHRQPSSLSEMTDYHHQRVLSTGSVGSCWSYMSVADDEGGHSHHHQRSLSQASVDWGTYGAPAGSPPPPPPPPPARYQHDPYDTSRTATPGNCPPAPARYQHDPYDSSRANTPVVVVSPPSPSPSPSSVPASVPKYRMVSNPNTTQMKRRPRICVVDTSDNDRSASSPEEEEVVRMNEGAAAVQQHISSFSVSAVLSTQQHQLFSLPPAQEQEQQQPPPYYQQHPIMAGQPNTTPSTTPEEHHQQQAGSAVLSGPAPSADARSQRRQELPPLSSQPTASGKRYHAELEGEGIRYVPFPSNKAVQQLIASRGYSRDTSSGGPAALRLSSKRASSNGSGSSRSHTSSSSSSISIDEDANVASPPVVLTTVTLSQVPFEVKPEQLLWVVLALTQDQACPISIQPNLAKRGSYNFVFSNNSLSSSSASASSHLQCLTDTVLFDYRGVWVAQGPQQKLAMKHRLDLLHREKMQQQQQRKGKEHQPQQQKLRLPLACLGVRVEGTAVLNPNH